VTEDETITQALMAATLGRVEAPALRADLFGTLYRTNKSIRQSLVPAYASLSKSAKRLTETFSGLKFNA